MNATLKVQRMNRAVIKSGNTAALLTFSDRGREYFTVSYESPSITLSKRVWIYTDCKYLVSLFSEMNENWKGWKGTKEWASIEGEFGISATCSNLGHIMLEIKFREVDGPETWDAQVHLGLDSGQLERTAKDLASFFASSDF